MHVFLGTCHSWLYACLGTFWEASTLTKSTLTVGACQDIIAVYMHVVCCAVYLIMGDFLITMGQVLFA